LVEQVGQQLVMAAPRRAPAAIGYLAVIRCWGGRGAGGGQPAAGVCLGVLLATSVGTAARRWHVHGGRIRPDAAAEGGAGRAPSWWSR
jgi:hypothetical protein